MGLSQFLPFIGAIHIWYELIDNYGDVGFACRLARLFTHQWPKLEIKLCSTQPATKEIYNLFPFFETHEAYENDYLKSPTILIQTLGCHIPDSILNLAYHHTQLILNIEHLSLEPWAIEYHQKPSLLDSTICRKFFIMPGFYKGTGGVLIEPSRYTPLLNNDRLQFFKTLMSHPNLKKVLAITPLIGSIFSYEHNFRALIDSLLKLCRPILIIVCGEKSQASLQWLIQKIQVKTITKTYFQIGLIHVTFIPMIEQLHYDRLLCACDFNIVRGEESLVGAILAGHPFIWHAYCQKDQEHLVKVKSFLDLFAPFVSNINILENYSRLLLEFNDRDQDAITQGKEQNFDFFFENLSKIGYDSLRFRQEVSVNHDLMVQLIPFINQFMNME